MIVVIIILGLIIVINLLSLLCKKDNKVFSTDHVVIRHTAVGIMKLREGEKCQTRYTYGEK